MKLLKDILSFVFSSAFTFYLSIILSIVFIFININIYWLIAIALLFIYGIIISIYEYKRYTVIHTSIFYYTFSMSNFMILSGLITTILQYFNIISIQYIWIIINLIIILIYAIISYKNKDLFY